MAQDFDDFPVNDPILDPNDNRIFGNVWRSSMSTFIQTLIGYLSQYGIFVPKLTTAQRNTIQVKYDEFGVQTSPGAGQLIYNTTTNELQVYKPLPTGWTVVI